MIKIRLHGTDKELKEFTALVSRVTKVLSCSAPYKDRGASSYSRVYIDCEMLELACESAVKHVNTVEKDCVCLETFEKV